MAITVQMIVDKEFKVKVKGYDQVEVDDFLDAICDEMIAMQDEINSLQSKLRAHPGRQKGTRTGACRPRGQGHQRNSQEAVGQRPAGVRPDGRGRPQGGG